MVYYKKWNGENIHKAVAVTKSKNVDGNFSIVSMKVTSKNPKKDDNPYSFLFRKQSTPEQ